MLKFIYGLELPVDIYAKFSNEDKEDVTGDKFQFNYFYKDGAESIIFGVDYLVAKDDCIKFTKELVDGINDAGISLMDEIFNSKLEKVLKMWLEAFGNITKDNNEEFDNMSQEERYAIISHLALPESVQIDWYILGEEN